MKREAASTLGYRVAEADGGFAVTRAGAWVAGPFTSDALAWRWIDRQAVARRYRGRHERA
jgi:hypothetical protein